VVIPGTPWVTTRDCPHDRGTAIIVGGVTVVHVSATEADSIGRELITRAVVGILAVPKAAAA
jgi:hypothetical protein